MRVRFAGFALLAAIGGCRTLAGIEDISVDNSKAGTSGTENSEGTGAKPNQTGGNGGSAAEGARQIPDAGAGSGGTEQETTLSVRGRIVDLSLKPLANVSVLIGEQQVDTDSNGLFIADSVRPPYDVAFTVTWADTYGGPNHVDAWCYQGLSRPDPTLQVFRGEKQHVGRIAPSITGVSFPLPDTAKIALAFGSPDGVSWYMQTAADDTFRTWWWGPEQTTGTLHAVKALYAEGAKFPTSYADYGSARALLADETQTKVELDFSSKNSISTGSITGRVENRTTAVRENHVYVQFPDNATLPLIPDYDGPDTFSYKLPSLPNGKIIVAAEDGLFVTGFFSIAHQEAVLNAPELKLAPPTPAELLLPIENATGVDLSTMFSWSGTLEVVSMLSIGFGNDLDNQNPRIFIITRDQRTQVPNLERLNFQLPSQIDAAWYVHVHGTFATMNEATAPSGLLDPFSETGEPTGAIRSSGVYSKSALRWLTTTAR